MTPLNGQMTLDEALRAACHGGRVEAELLAPAIETLARELRRLDPEAIPANIGGIVLAGENAGIADALTALDFLFVALRSAQDRAHAAEVAKVLP